MANWELLIFVSLIIVVFRDLVETYSETTLVPQSALQYTNTMRPYDSLVSHPSSVVPLHK